MYPEVQLAPIFKELYPYTDISLFRVIGLWRQSLSKVNKKAADSLADPTEYENLFPGLRDIFKAEQYVATQRNEQGLHPASAYPSVPVSYLKFG